MPKGKLITRDGGFVTDFDMPPFQLLPEAAVWGSRIFVIDKPFEQSFGHPAKPIYREVCGWSVDASKALSEIDQAARLDEPSPLLDPQDFRNRDSEAPRTTRAQGSTTASVAPVDRTARVLTNGLQESAMPDYRATEASGQQKAYVVLSSEERAKGFVRPVRRSYRHNTCGAVTTMGLALAETYARDPTFYSGTFCVNCRTHFPLDQFVWEGTTEQLGS